MQNSVTTSKEERWAGIPYIMGLAIFVFNIILAIYFLVQSQVLAVICVFLSELLALTIWTMFLILRRKYEKGIQAKDKIIKQFQEKENVYISCVASISDAIKSNTLHTNDYLIRIPNLSELQYELISRAQDQVQAHPEDIELQYSIKAEIIDAIINYQDELVDVFNQYCRHVTDEAVDLFESYFKMKGIEIKAAITIKLLNEPLCSFASRINQEDKALFSHQIDAAKVYTAFRDNATYKANEREIGGKPYSISHNTAFLKCTTSDECILDKGNMSAEGYLNENTEYKKFYNCAIAVPIKIKLKTNSYKYFGFLSCDCLDESDQDSVMDKTGARYLFAMAQNLASFMETLDSNWHDRFDGLQYVPVPKNILQVLNKKILKVSL